MKQAQRGRSAWGSLLTGLALMTRAERRRAAALVVVTLVTGAIDVLALGASMPFISLLVDPSFVENSRLLQPVRHVLDGIGYDRLVVAVGLGSLFLVLLSTISTIIVQRWANRFAGECQARLAQDIMRTLVNAPYAWFLTVNTAATAHVLTRDVAIWARELLLKSLVVLRDVTMILFPTALVVYATPVAGLTALAAIGLLIFLVLLPTRPRIAAMIRIKQEADTQAHALASQALTGVKDVKISGRGEAFIGRYARVYGRFTWSHANLMNWHQMPLGVILAAGQVGLLVIALTLWAIGTDRGELVAQLALLVLVTSRVLPAANRLTSAVATFLGVVPAIEALLALLGSADKETRDAAQLPLPDAAPRPPWRRCVLDRVGYTYPTAAAPSLIDVSLTIEARRSYGIVGASGAGKTTAVDVLAGLLTPTEGALRVDGEPIVSRADLASWQRRVRYVTQNPFISDDTLAANIAFGVRPEDIDKGRLDDAIAAADLQTLVRDLPQGVETPLGERGIRLSGGQRQRIAIARALYDDAELLVLDEATSALDNQSERAIQTAIERLHGKLAIVTIAHRLSTIRRCETLFFFEAGRLVAQGSWDELVDASPAFRRMAETDSEAATA